MMVDRRHCHDGAFVFECDIDEKVVRLARAAIQFVLTQRLERGTQLGAVKLRLFPGREVAAPYRLHGSKRVCEKRDEPTSLVLDRALPERP